MRMVYYIRWLIVSLARALFLHATLIITRQTTDIIKYTTLDAVQYGTVYSLQYSAVLYWTV